MTTITLPRAVVEQALETIEGLTRDRLFTAEWAGKHGATVAALRAALAQQAEPVEPVAAAAVVATQSDVWRGHNGQWAPPGEPIKMVLVLVRDLPTGTLLYTASPQRKPLTLEEAQTLLKAERIWLSNNTAFRITRAVERAHGIKE